jgi:hypothetical protein
LSRYVSCCLKVTLEERRPIAHAAMVFIGPAAFGTVIDKPLKHYE